MYQVRTLHRTFMDHTSTFLHSLIVFSLLIFMFLVLDEETGFQTIVSFNYPKPKASVKSEFYGRLTDLNGLKHAVDVEIDVMKQEIENYDNPRKTEIKALPETVHKTPIQELLSNQKLEIEAPTSSNPSSFPKTNADYCPKQPNTSTLPKNNFTKFKTDPEKYLIPLLLWGPSNQLVGLRETIALSLILNRTLVLPKLYRHYVDPASGKAEWNDAIDPGIKISVTRLQKLLPVIYIDELPKICPDSKDIAILPARKIDFETPRFHIRYIHLFDIYQGWVLTDYTKFIGDGSTFDRFGEKNLFDGKNPSKVGKPRLNHYPLPLAIKTSQEWPFNAEKTLPIIGENTEKRFGDKIWRETYGPQKLDSKCAVRFGPMKTMTWYGRDDVLKLEAEEMRDLVANHTMVPEYIEDLTELFRLDTAKSRKNEKRVKRDVYEENIVKNKIPKLKLAIHWRWNFELHYDHDKKIGNYTTKSLVDKILANPENLSTGVFSYVSKYLETIDSNARKYRQENQLSTINTLQVYLSGPNDVISFLKAASQHFLEKVDDFEKIEKVVVFSSHRLEGWYEKRYLKEKRCDWVADNWYDISSSMEQKLCEEANIFLHSAPVSTWSGVVRDQRNSLVEMKMNGVFDEKYILEAVADFL